MYRKRHAFLPAGRNMYKKGDLHLYEDKVYYADSNLFRIFTFPFIQGDPRTALLAPNSMVLTEETAIKFFGNTTGVIGQTLQTANGDNFKITGILKDVPLNSHIRFNMLLSASTLPRGDNNWGNFNVYTYVLLHPNADPAAFQKKLEPMYDKYMAQIFKPVNVKIHYTRPSDQLDPPPFRPPAGTRRTRQHLLRLYLLGGGFFYAAHRLYQLYEPDYGPLGQESQGDRHLPQGHRFHTAAARRSIPKLESTLTAVLALLLSIGFVALLLPGLQYPGRQESIALSTILQPGMFSLGLLLAMVLFVGFSRRQLPRPLPGKIRPHPHSKGQSLKKLQQHDPAEDPGGYSVLHRHDHADMYPGRLQPAEFYPRQRPGFR